MTEVSATPAPLAGRALSITAVAVALGAFMQVLDASIANVSLPTIAGDLGVSTDQGTWVITAFAVANGVSVPLTGWLMGRYGVVRTYVASVILFTLASLLCGLAWNLISLVGFRILQGGVSGPMIGGSQALLISIFPANRRGAALAIWAMTTMLAPICGPLLGGFISDNYTWPWIFLINVPVGVTCAILCWRGLASRETPTLKTSIDMTGLALLVIWVGALQVMLDTGKNADWFASPVIMAEAIIAAVGCLAWIIWEVTESNPIVDLSLFRTRNFAFGAVATCLGYGVFFGNTVFQSVWLQTRMGYIATWAGLTAAPAGVVAVMFSPFVARFMARFDARWVASFSLAAFAVAMWMRAGFTQDADFVTLMLPSLVQGAAIATFFVSLITIMLNGVPASQLPKATGLANFARITAGAFGASTTITLWDSRAALHQTRLVEAAGVSDPALPLSFDKLTHAGLSAPQALSVLNQQFDAQAYLLATLDVFAGSALVMLLLIPCIWLTRPAGGTGSGAPVAAD